MDNRLDLTSITYFKSCMRITVLNCSTGGCRCPDDPRAKIPIDAKCCSALLKLLLALLVGVQHLHLLAELPRLRGLPQQPVRLSAEPRAACLAAQQGKRKSQAGGPVKQLTGVEPKKPVDIAWGQKQQAQGLAVLSSFKAEHKPTSQHIVGPLGVMP